MMLHKLMNGATQSKTDPNSPVAGMCLGAGVFIAVGFSLWCLQASPYPFADEGGYINMLASFFQTGKMDLMQWSQPTYLGAVPFALLALPFHNPLGFSHCGILAAALSLIGIFFIAQRHGHRVSAILLALSPLYVYDFVATMPTCMSDQFFLFYLIWSIAFLDLSVSNPKLLSFSTTCTLLASITRANGYLLLLCEIVAALIEKTGIKRLCMHALICFIVGVALSLAITVNPIPLMKVTSIPSVVLDHDYALFDVRAAIKALIEILPGLLPALILCFDKSRIRRTDFIVSIFVSAICLYFCAKNRIGSPIANTSNLVLMLFVPVSMLLLSASVRNAKSHLNSTCFIFALASLLVMPIMPHPLTRHALPAACAIIIALAADASCSVPRKRAIAAWFLALLLMGSNFYSTFQARMQNSSQWIAANNALSSGIPESDLFVNWSWFCSRHLIPGKIENFDYVSLYHQQETSSPFLIQDGQLVRR